MCFGRKLWPSMSLLEFQRCWSPEYDLDIPGSLITFINSGTRRRVLLSREPVASLLVFQLLYHHPLAASLRHLIEMVLSNLKIDHFLYQYLILKNQGICAPGSDVIEILAHWTIWRVDSFNGYLNDGAITPPCIPRTQYTELAFIIWFAVWKAILKWKPQVTSLSNILLAS